MRRWRLCVCARVVCCAAEPPRCRLPSPCSHSPPPPRTRCTWTRSPARRRLLRGGSTAAAAAVAPRERRAGSSSDFAGAPSCVAAGPRPWPRRGRRAFFVPLESSMFICVMNWPGEALEQMLRCRVRRAAAAAAARSGVSVAALDVHNTQTLGDRSSRKSRQRESDTASSAPPPRATADRHQKQNLSTASARPRAGPSSPRRTPGLAAARAPCPRTRCS